MQCYPWGGRGDSSATVARNGCIYRAHLLFLFLGFACTSSDVFDSWSTGNIRILYRVCTVRIHSMYLGLAARPGVNRVPVLLPLSHDSFSQNAHGSRPAMARPAVKCIDHRLRQVLRQPRSFTPPKNANTPGLVLRSRHLPSPHLQMQKNWSRSPQEIKAYRIDDRISPTYPTIA